MVLYFFRSTADDESGKSPETVQYCDSLTIWRQWDDSHTSIVWGVPATGRSQCMIGCCNNQSHGGLHLLRGCTSKMATNQHGHNKIGHRQKRQQNDDKTALFTQQMKSLPQLLSYTQNSESHIGLLRYGLRTDRRTSFS